jgi:RNA polymerase sigma factor (sigma-70 family)
VTTEAILRELEGMRALARSLVHGDAEAEDLLQDAAVATLEHPPATDRPVRPWLAAVLRNRRRMDLRGAARRAAREEIAAAAPTEAADAMLDRARTLERLAAALVALDEPFRTTVMRRYLDGQSCADIARTAGVPAGTVRWRLKTGLERLRAALAAGEPRWRQALVPLLPGAVVKTKTSILLVAILVLLLGAGAIVLALHRTGDGASSSAGSAGASRATVPVLAPGRAPPAAATPAPQPGQGKPTVERVDVAGGVVSGRVINWSTGDGVVGAELTFSGSDGGATTVRSRTEGVFELAPAAPGRFTLTAISAPGFLPYAPELLHSTVHVELAAERAVRGITVFLFPALDYHGKVVDAKGAPVAGAKVRLLGTPTGEQAIDKLETEWTSDKDGAFTFHAADEAVFEAVRGPARGWARLDPDVMITHQLVITVKEQAAHDATITGHVVDAGGAPVRDVLVRASPRGDETTPRATAFATTAADGAFTLADLDRGPYDLAAHAEGFAPAERDKVPGGTRDVTLVLDGGKPISGRVSTTDHEPVPAYTLLVLRREGAVRDLVVARSVVEASGRFEVRVSPGDYDLVASASGWAPSAPTRAAAGARDVELVVTAGATLRGTIVAADNSSPIQYARVMREATDGGASAQPANAGTVTRSDGTFELTGIPPGRFSVRIGAGGFNPKIEAGLQASDGATLGPLTIPLARLAPGEQPSLELVGIGVAMAADGDALRVNQVFPGSGAAQAGIVVGDHIVAVDGAPASELGVEGAVAKIRGVAGTTVSVTLRRGDQLVTLVVERRKLKA